MKSYMKTSIIAILFLVNHCSFNNSDYKILGDAETIEDGLKNRSDIIFYGGFESNFNDSIWNKKWGIAWTNRIDQSEILFGNGSFIGDRTLRISYPKDGVGPQETGCQFPINFENISGNDRQYFDSLYLRYYVKFEENFDFRLGGKLPGLMGGEDSFERSGGDHPDGTNGWTMRFMWREKGEAVVYAYLPPSKYSEGDWGTDIKLNRFFEPGKWHCIEQYIKINEPGEQNGTLKVWFDDEKVLELTDVFYLSELNNSGRIGGIYFSTFHGGNSPEWAPAILSFAQFDGITAAHKRVGLFIKHID